MSTMDPAKKAAQERDERIAAQFAASEARADKAAGLSGDGRTDTSPDIVDRGSEADVNDEFTFDDSDYDSQRAASKRIRAARAYGNLQPAQYLVKDDVLIGPKVRDKYELEAVATGVFCWKCCDSQPEDEHIREEKLKRLELYAHYVRPTDKRSDELCCTCGAILGLRQKVA